jgi:hypothetical protein
MSMIGKTTAMVAGAALLALAGGLGVGAQSALQPAKMSFFITSVGSGKGADFGGLAGADAHCASLAKAAGSPKTSWKAYLSTGGAGAVNARDRIGKGPWYNARGVEVAKDLADLHGEAPNMSKVNELTEKGGTVKGRGDTPNEHDLLTGSKKDGTLATNDQGQPLTCNNWTSSGAGAAKVGHFDRQGGGADPTSWNAAHDTRGCSQPDLVATGGAGYLYCFASN